MNKALIKIHFFPYYVANTNFSNKFYLSRGLDTFYVRGIDYKNQKFHWSPWWDLGRIEVNSLNTLEALLRYKEAYKIVTKSEYLHILKTLYK